MRCCAEACLEHGAEWFEYCDVKQRSHMEADAVDDNVSKEGAPITEFMNMRQRKRLKTSTAKGLELAEDFVYTEREVRQRGGRGMV